MTSNAPDPGAHWSVTGPADAPPIVFVHGAMMGRSVWWPQVEALSDRFRCVAVDHEHVPIGAALDLGPARDRVRAAIGFGGVVEGEVVLRGA